jgi:hypothetical protein
VGQGPEGQGGGGRIPELISTNEKPKKTGPLSPAGKQDCPSLGKGARCEHQTTPCECSGPLDLAITFTTVDSYGAL